LGIRFEGNAAGRRNEGAGHRGGGAVRGGRRVR
jgi:hypothetical protein